MVKLCQNRGMCNLVRNLIAQRESRTHTHTHVYICSAHISSYVTMRVQVTVYFKPLTSHQSNRTAHLCMNTFATIVRVCKGKLWKNVFKKKKKTRVCSLSAIGSCGETLMGCIFYFNIHETRYLFSRSVPVWI